MSKVYAEQSMSLDGFTPTTGPNVRVGNGMGDDGDRLHGWRFDAKTETDAKVFEGLDPEEIELRKVSSIDTPGATHFRFEVVKRRT